MDFAYSRDVNIRPDGLSTGLKFIKNMIRYVIAEIRYAII